MKKRNGENSGLPVSRRWLKAENNAISAAEEKQRLSLKLQLNINIVISACNESGEMPGGGQLGAG